jgi:uncharacterized protein involved in exopolysaccharide biosynthesis
MTVRSPNLPLAPVPEGEEEEGGLDGEQLRERLGFALRAPRRRPKLAITVFVFVASVGLAVAATMPRTYSAQTKMLAQKNLVVPALTNPNRSLEEADNPTKNVRDMILRRDNLVALATQLDLANRTAAARSPLTRLKDSVLGAPKTDEERVLGMVKTLENKLAIWSDDSTVNISVDWGEPKMAYDIVSTVQHNFLEARYDDQVAMIQDAISVLQDHAKIEHDRLDAALDEYQKLLAVLPKSHGQAPALAPQRPTYGGVAYSRPAANAPTTTAVNPDVQSALDDTRRQIQAIEGERQRQLDALRQQLTQAQLTLTPQHPTVQALEQQIEAHSQPSPELVQLRNQERTLAARLTPPPSPSAGTAPPPSVVPRVPTAAALPPAPAVPPLPDWDDDGRAQLARSKLESAIKAYEDVAGRIEAANVQLDIARTAFKYRYTVVTPAEIPNRPKKPVALMVAIGSAVGAALLAILLSVAADMLGGRFLEAWQVRRRLKLDVLGEIDSP